MAHERLADHRYSDAIELFGRALPSMAYDGQVYLDLADAQEALHNYPAALKALQDANQALFKPAQKAISDREDRIKRESRRDRFNHLGGLRDGVDIFARNVDPAQDCFLYPFANMIPRVATGQTAW